jgi:transketolase
MDIVAWLYLEELNAIDVGVNDPNRDVYFSSKGHDVPGLYSVLYALGVLTEKQLLGLRRLGGLDGHPEVHIPGIEANSGSLGMGISKARGIAWAKQRTGRGGRVFVLTGDGELQEGQNYEAFHTTPHQRVNDLVVIVDHNKLQTDRRVSDITNLGDLPAAVRAFGWHVLEIDGHDFAAIESALNAARELRDRPKLILAHTIKGRGVGFMEGSSDAGPQREVYRWHSGAPDNTSFLAASAELRQRISELCAEQGIPPVSFAAVEPLTTADPAPKVYVADAYGEALLALAEEVPELVVLDGDLAADCRVRAFEDRYPDRFIENGIAEQDMVSMAGGLARHGLLPVVNSFASFLAARANEQIYNNATEHSKIIYALHFAGLIPAGPGKSHQSVRDVALLSALPNCVIIQPGTPAETRAAVEWCVRDAETSCALRLAIGPSPRQIELPENYVLTEGKGVELTQGRDALLFAYGPVMLHEALTAAELLADSGFGLRVVNMPWLNRFNRSWLAEVTKYVPAIFVLDDHSVHGGLGDLLLSELVASGLLRGRPYATFGVEGYPACGTPSEVLRHHRLDGAALAERILPGRETIKPLPARRRELAYSAEAPQ